LVVRPSFWYPRTTTISTPDVVCLYLLAISTIAQEYNK